MPEAAFRRVMQRLQPEQIRSFPEDLVPQTIDPAWVASLPDPARRAAIEQLIWSRISASAEASELARAYLDEETYQALEAIDGASATGADQLEERTEVLLTRSAGSAGTRGGAKIDRDTLTSAREVARELSDTYGRLWRNRLYLEQVHVSHESVQARIDSARRHAANITARLERALGRFRLLEMDLAVTDMEGYLRDCEASLTKQQVIDEQITELKAKLNRESRLFRRLLRPGIARYQRKTIRDRIKKLNNDLRQTEIPVSEDRLCSWLDVLTESSLLADFGEWRNKAHQMRPLLYRLLNIYCQQQEGAARRVVRQPMSGRQAREAVDYYIASERFILAYFARKRQEITLWLSGAAREKLATLDSIRDEILRDYRHGGTQATASEAA